MVTPISPPSTLLVQMKTTPKACGKSILGVKPLWPYGEIILMVIDEVLT